MSLPGEGHEDIGNGEQGDRAHGGCGPFG
jgi:hypothetical protein